jgi:hypothetical protein
LLTEAAELALVVDRFLNAWGGCHARRRRLLRPGAAP